MRRFLKLAQGVDIIPLLREIHAQPELWGQYTERKTGPHVDMSDIWVRYRPYAELIEPGSYKEQHIPAFYPAWYALPSLRPIIFQLMARVAAVQLGGILITRIPPGCQIKPHNDLGSWHAEFFNCKAYLPLKSNEMCVNYCEDEAVVMRPGEVWEFNNLLEHSVKNSGDDDRITVIVSMRVEQ